MTATALSDLFVTACYGLYVFLLAMSSVWRDARQQLGASL
jgi:hypothetical protein